MAIDADPHWVTNFEARIINNFFERLRDFVHPQKFDLQMQLALAVQEEQHKMTDWREVTLFPFRFITLSFSWSRPTPSSSVPHDLLLSLSTFSRVNEVQANLFWSTQAHGLPVCSPSRENFATTPPMTVPFIDHQFPTLANSFATSCGESEASFNGLPGWTSGSSSSSPFRQSVHQNVVDNTVSPREVVFHGSYAMAHPGSYADDMGMFTFSDSESSMHSLPQPTLPSTHNHKEGQRYGTPSRSSQSHSFQQGRHPLPEGPGQALPRNQFGGLDTYGHHPEGTVGQQSYSIGARQEAFHREPILRSNGPSSVYGNKPLRPSRRQQTPQAPTNAFGGPDNGVLTSSTQASPIFPPGKDMPGFVPIGRIGIATAAQGNRWPIERQLMERLVGAERGHGEYRRNTRLTYKEILAKYSRWDLKESTLRGIKRKITLPKEHRERKPRWDAEHVSINPRNYTRSSHSPLLIVDSTLQINSLRLHVPTYTDKKGKVAWTKVVDAIKRDTGRPFGAGTTSKKWSDINKPQNRKGRVTDQLHQSGGEEGDIDETESPLSALETVDTSEEDLPSHNFSFHGDDDDNDSLGGVGGYASVTSSMSRIPNSGMWH